MKLQRIRITIEPLACATRADGHKTFTVEVIADGRRFSTLDHYDDDHFQDVFGHIMRAVERSIRNMAAGHLDALKIVDKLT